MENDKGKYLSTEYRSWWIKHYDYCKSMVLASKSLGDDKWYFEFVGYNPFPCFSMISTYGVLSKWLEDNGWELATEKIRKTTMFENHTIIEYY